MGDVFTEIHNDCKYLGVISDTELVNNKPKKSPAMLAISKTIT